ncbi:MAG: hypothetical protein JWO41_794 [Candidatus Saccharibacteria bacterium]|nr:hypothetical protein [Candidatus Saccharibacteria bacterium]
MHQPLIENLSLDVARFAEPRGGIELIAAGHKLAADEINMHGDINDLVDSIDGLLAAHEAAPQEKCAEVVVAIGTAAISRRDSLPHIMAAYGYADHAMLGMDPAMIGYTVGRAGGLDMMKLLMSHQILPDSVLPEDDADTETLRHNLVNLAHLFESIGTEGLKDLKARYNIHWISRYPVEQLIEQHAYSKSGPSDGFAEVPIYTASSFDDAINDSYLYQYMYDMAVIAGDLQPVIYEVDYAESFVAAMAEARKPAFGVIRAHGNTEGFDFSMAYNGTFYGNNPDIDPSYIKQAKRLWRRAGGLVLSSCNTAYKESGHDDIADQVANLFGVDVIASKGEVATVDLRRGKKNPERFHFALYDEHDDCSETVLKRPLKRSPSDWLVIPDRDAIVKSKQRNQTAKPTAA